MNKAARWMVRRYYLTIGIALAIAGAFLQPYLVGEVYSEAKAIQLVEGVQRSSLYYGSAMATACATILALMLTLLGLARQSQAEFKYELYATIRVIATMATVGFIGSVILLLILSLPVGEFKKIPEGWFMSLYYTLTTLNFLLAGVVVAVVLSLSSAIHHAIAVLSPDFD